MGSTIWEYLNDYPDRGALFDAVMHTNHARDLDTIALAYDFSFARMVVDVGGGDGSLLKAILGAYPELRGVVLDRPDVVQRAAHRVDDSPVAARLEYLSGDFFENVPPDGDIYILKHILHDWDEDRCICVLRRCRERMRKSSTLLIIEGIQRDGFADGSSWLDLGVMAIGGRERTLAEYERLLAAANLAATEVLPCSAGVTLIEGKVAEVKP